MPKMSSIISRKGKNSLLEKRKLVIEAKEAWTLLLKRVLRTSFAKKLLAEPFLRRRQTTALDADSVSTNPKVTVL